MFSSYLSSFRFVKTLRRSLLIDSTTKKLEKESVNSPVRTPLAIMRATSAIRRSFSRDERTPEKNTNRYIIVRVSL